MWVSRRTDYATQAILTLAIEDGQSDRSGSARAAHLCAPSPFSSR